MMRPLSALPASKTTMTYDSRCVRTFFGKMNFRRLFRLKCRSTGPTLLRARRSQRSLLITNTFLAINSSLKYLQRNISEWQIEQAQ